MAHCNLLFLRQIYTTNIQITIVEQNITKQTYVTMKHSQLAEFSKADE